jgi:LmbE family N-acetylglucosaminyl deacetylase
MHLGFTQMQRPANGKKLVAISPHLDDVVLGCSDLVAAHPGALVVTVTAGRPGPHELTDWDRQCGFGPGEDVIRARREEDAAALRQLGATPVWLDFLDRQYSPDWSSPDPGQVATALRPVVADAGLVASPLGMLHPDHVAVARACYEVARTLPDLPWVIYEDAIYRARPGATAEAITRMGALGLALTDVQVAPDSRKRSAVELYTSQLKGLGELVLDANQPERYWTLVSGT